MDPKCSTILVSFGSLQKDGHFLMPYPEERRYSRTPVQTLQRIAGRYDTSSSLNDTSSSLNDTSSSFNDTSSSLSAKHVPNWTGPRSQVAGPPALLLTLSPLRPSSHAFVPSRSDIFRFFFLLSWLFVLSTVYSSSLGLFT